WSYSRRAMVQGIKRTRRQAVRETATNPYRRHLPSQGIKTLWEKYESLARIVSSSCDRLRGQCHCIRLRSDRRRHFGGASAGRGGHGSSKSRSELHAACDCRVQTL